MKKLLAIVLSVVCIVCFIPPVQANATKEPVTYLDEKVTDAPRTVKLQSPEVLSITM